jgi:uncharacterized protein (DUF1800 family)
MFWFHLAQPKTVLSAVLLAAALSACGGGGSDTATGGSATATAVAASAAESAASAAASSTTDSAQAAASAEVLMTATAVPVRAPTIRTLTVRASGMLADNVGPIMVVRVNGVIVGSVEVRSTQLQDYNFTLPALAAGAKVEVAYTNDAAVNGQDRNLIVAYITDGTTAVVPSQPGVVLDRGAGAAAFDGLDLGSGTEVLWGNGALRVAWPAAATTTAREYEASRFLQQATFGPTRAEIARLQTMSYSAWLDDQMSMVATPDNVNYIQSKYDLGADNLPPLGSKYTPEMLENAFWMGAAKGRDALRKRVGLALQEIFVASLTDSNLYHHSRAYANYVDTLNKYAFGNYRDLLEEMALSPVMGIYLSHGRNQKEDLAANRLPDENFAREVMQLFSIGLYELNTDGSLKLDSKGKPIETYSNADVMALAKVFTGWSWGFDDSQLSTYNFFYGWPDYSAKNSNRVDLRKMKAYAGLSSTAEKRLFTGKATPVVIAANTSANDALRMALDGLFNHPNVGPFMSRQLIQRLVSSNPTPAYISRVATVFNNNGKGVRGDMGAVVRAILLDTEARAPTSNSNGKIREPILRVAHWMRAFGATSVSGEYTMPRELTELGQRVFYSPSVFNYFRPGYEAPNTMLAAANLVTPEMQIVEESSTANWVNLMERMLNEGLGWSGSVRDISTRLTTETSLVASSPSSLLDHLNLLLFAGQMSSELRRNILDAMAGVDRSASNRDIARARIAIYLAMSSPEYLVQR